jgi:hypothetical protein
VKVRTWRVGLAVLALGASPAFAETSGWSYDNNVSGVAFASDCCEPACDDPCCSDDVACGDGCAAGGLFSGCGLAGPIEGFSLASMMGLEDSAIEVGGWTNIAYYNKNIPLSQSFDDLLSFDDIPNHANLAQQWFYIGKVADGSAGRDFGGRIDVLYGTDAQKSQAFGNPGALTRGFGFYDASLDHGYYGWAIPQAYLEVANGDLSTKIGHFFTPIGYEVIPATGNFFHTHSYTMFNSEPFTHTGFLSTYSGFEALTLYGGWTAGWDTGFTNLDGGSNFLGGFGYELNDNVTFTYLNTYGNFGWRGGKDSYSHSMVLTANVTDKLQYIAQSDVLDATDNPNAGQTETVGINQYLIYAYNDVLGIGGRAEWWKQDGTSYNEITGGVNIKALSNLVFRPEVRHDWSPGADIDQTAVAIDAILTY